MSTILPVGQSYHTPLVEKNTQKKSSLRQYLPFAGLIGGSLSGMATNTWNNFSLFSKYIKPIQTQPDSQEFWSYLFGASPQQPTPSFISTPLPELEIWGQPVFQTINSLKQGEIEANAFFIPYLPLIADVAASAIDKTYREGLRAGWEELKARCYHIPARKLLTPIIMCELGTTARFYARNALSSQDPTSLFYHFNPSGHVIAKTASALALYNAVETMGSQTTSKTQKVVATSLAVGVVATDAIMMYNTGATFHSAAEMVVGAAISLAVYPVAEAVSGGIVWTTNRIGSLAKNLFSSLTEPAY